MDDGAEHRGVSLRLRPLRHFRALCLPSPRNYPFNAQLKPAAPATIFPSFKIASKHSNTRRITIGNRGIVVTVDRGNRSILSSRKIIDQSKCENGNVILLLLFFKGE